MTEYYEILGVAGVLSLLWAILIYSSAILQKVRRSFHWLVKSLYTVLAAMLLWLLVPAFVKGVHADGTGWPILGMPPQFFLLPFLAAVGVAVIGLTIYLWLRR